MDSFLGAHPIHPKIFLTKTYDRHGMEESDFSMEASFYFVRVKSNPYASYCGVHGDDKVQKVIDLHTQLTYFNNVKKILREKRGDEDIKSLLARAVYLITIRSNDYFVENSSIYTHEKCISMVVGNLTALIKGIPEMGGRKFGVLNQPFMGCYPIIKAAINGTKEAWI
ncbi:hypothetical protein RYX36_023762 [Vicia faba]